MVADPFRAHLGQLLDHTGLPWPVLALKADVEPVIVRHLLFGHQGLRIAELPVTAAEKLFSLTADDLFATGRRWVPARETSRDVDALIADGFPPPSLARYCRLSLTQLHCLRGNSRCLEQTALLARSARLQYSALRPGTAG